MINEHYAVVAERLVSRYRNIASGAFPIDGLYLDNHIFFFFKDSTFLLETTTCKTDDERTFYDTVAMEATAMYRKEMGTVTPPVTGDAIVPFTPQLTDNSNKKRELPANVTLMAWEIVATITEILKITPNAIEGGFEYFGASLHFTVKPHKKIRVSNKVNDIRYAHAAMLATRLFSKQETGDSTLIGANADSINSSKVKKDIEDPFSRVISLAQDAYSKGMFSKEHFPIHGVYVVFDTVNFTVPAAYAHHPFLAETCQTLNGRWEPIYETLKQKKSVFTQYEVFRELGM
jgi:hypothetical protein